MSASLVNPARKVTDSGKWRIVSLDITPGAGDTNPEVTVDKLRVSKRVRMIFRIDFSGIKLAKACPEA
jgi:hypothetical protein